MNIETVLAAALLQGFFITSSSAISGARGTRGSCFDHNQENCNEDFTDVYKNLSKSESGTEANSFFLLYTRSNEENPEKLHKCGGRLPPNSKFDPTKRVIILLPSFMSEWCDLEIYREWKDEILKKEDANVIGFDYTWEGTNYEEAHENIQIAAKQVITVLKNIQAQTGVENLNVYLIGISLGSQMAGFIGRDFPIKRITGLDPAGPGFRKDRPSAERLDPSDAEFVDVVHCNAGHENPKLGIDYDAGHINFWMNGGTVQESCHTETLGSLAKLDVLYGFATVAGPDICYHLQCTKYFKASINDCNFVGIKCESYDDFKGGKCKGCGPSNRKCAVMGFDADKNLKQIPQKPQKYYIKTKLEYPYCDDNYIHWKRRYKC